MVVALIYLAITTFITVSVAGLEQYANRHMRRAV
jgi:ABC-type arginine transport system permease subunit